VADARAHASESPPEIVPDEAPAPARDEPAVQRRSAAAVPPPAPRAPSWTGVLGAGAGAQGRISAAEALVLLHGDARHRSGAMLTVRAAVAPSITGALRVADTFVTAGAGWGFHPHARLRFELAAAIGVAIHGYSRSSERDARVDVTAELPVTFAVVLGPRVELGLTALAGVSGRARSHLVAGNVEWSRSRWRVAGVASVRIVLGRKLSGPSTAGGT